MFSLYGEPLNRNHRHGTREKIAASIILRPPQSQRQTRAKGRSPQPPLQHFSNNESKHRRHREREDAGATNDRRGLRTNVLQEKQALNTGSKQREGLDRRTPKERRKVERDLKGERQNLDNGMVRERRKTANGSPGGKRKHRADNVKAGQRVSLKPVRERPPTDTELSKNHLGLGADAGGERPTKVVPNRRKRSPGKSEHRQGPIDSTQNQKRTGAELARELKEPKKDLVKSPGEVGRGSPKFHNRFHVESPRAVYEVESFSSPLLDGKWKFLQKLGTGNFGEVYEAVNVYSGGKVAVKIASAEQSKTLLGIEYEFYKYLNQSGRVRFVPYCNFYGLCGRGTALVMDLLGRSLQQMKDDNGGTLPLATVFSIGVKVIKCLEGLHETGVLHRDIKPDNILSGISNKSALYLVDFGLAGSYRSPANGRHIPKPGSSAGFVGTARYASLNVHGGIPPTRRDDLISLGYCLVYLYRGSLPWQNVNEKDPDREVEAMGRKKRLSSFESLCSDMGKRMIDYFQHLGDLSFAHKPDYNYLVHLLNIGFIEASFADRKRLE